VRISTIHHVGLQVDDLDAATRFYVDILGMARRTDRPADLPPGVWIDAGDKRLNLAPRGQSVSGSHLAMVVEDLEQAVDELARADVPVRHMASPLLNVMIQDPSGNWLELRQPPSVWARHFA
jgi:catechol 2,3-dioxygenase-like lactoylglutathione lyase family enzyme